MENKILEVKNLVISFRTVSGKVQAVRNISFDLEKGKTLAIVGESGSGKSVTAKAVMGILAGNSIVEGGEIIYDGQDLLKIDEEDFHKLRGNKISMVFQDPMSSLNPIVKIGKQLTEAMILKGKSKQRECRRNFNLKMKLLLKNLREIAKDEDEQKQFVELCKRFDTFESRHVELERAFNIAYRNAADSIIEIKDALFEIEKKAFTDPKIRLNNIYKKVTKVENEFVVKDINVIKQDTDTFKKLISPSVKNKEYTEIVECLTRISKVLEEATSKTKPDFFALAHHITFVESFYDDSNIEEMNKRFNDELNELFLDNFIKVVERGIRHSYDVYKEKREEVINLILSNMGLFEGETISTEAKAVSKEIIKLQKTTLNRLELTKDSTSYTFAQSLKSQIVRYFGGASHNKKEEKRFAKDNAKIDKILAKGKVPTWKPNPPAIVDLKLTQQNIVSLLNGLVKRYKELNEQASSYDYVQLSNDTIANFKENAAGFANRVTRSMARNDAIKIMTEVGIPEPRRRFYQYPFEFSGGMRQRIVIAIALVANPQILICDEPTTALDVTIQANILELINKLKRERNLSIIFITHDLGVVANMADRVAVMYAGKIVEYGTSEEVFFDPRHPYTWALLSSMPDLETNEKLDAIPGTPPNMIYPPVGDAFAARNKYAMKIDFEKEPPMFKVNDNHYAATWLLHKDAPHVEPPKIVTERIKRMKGATLHVTNN